MQVKKMEKFVAENKLLMQFILQGFTNDEIAKKLNYSTSTVSNHINNLIKQYGAKNRYEFVLKVLNKALELFKKKAKMNEDYIIELKSKNKQLILLLEKLIENKANKEKYRFLLKEAKTCIENFTY